MQQGDTKRRNFCEAANSRLSYLSSIVDIASRGADAVIGLSRLSRSMTIATAERVPL